MYLGIDGLETGENWREEVVKNENLLELGLGIGHWSTADNWPL